MPSLSVNVKILVAIGVAAAVAAGVGALSLSRMSHLDRNVAGLTDVNMPRMVALADLREAVAQSRIAMLNHGLAQTDAAKKKYDGQIATADQQAGAALTAYTAHPIGDPKWTDDVAQFRDTMRQFRVARDQDLLPASRKHDMAL